MHSRYISVVFFILFTSSLLHFAIVPMHSRYISVVFFILFTSSRLPHTARSGQSCCLQFCFLKLSSVVFSAVPLNRQALERVRSTFPLSSLKTTSSSDPQHLTAFNSSDDQKMTATNTPMDSRVFIFPF